MIGTHAPSLHTEQYLIFAGLIPKTRINLLFDNLLLELNSN